MNQHATPVSRSAAPGNANDGVAQPVPRATMMLQTSAAARANKITNAVQPSPAHLSNPPASVRCCHATMRTRTPTDAGGPLKSP